MMESGDHPLLGKTLGQYKLTQLLGKGGMGSVWLSEHPFLKIPVAIKVLDSKLASSDEFIKRFVQEGQLAASINHNNIVRVYDANKVEDLYYMVLEYIDGCDVKEMTKNRGGRLPVDEVLEIAWKIGQALREASNLNIIHRDIKPENILVTSDGELKLADMGIAKKIGGEGEDEYGLTMTGVAIGTPYYISPEQGMDSKNIDLRSDMYSLGATMYHLLTGTVPFSATTPVAMMVKHANEALEHPQQRCPELPDNFCAVVCKMMMKKPDDRYQNYDEFLGDIEAIRNFDAEAASLTAFMGKAEGKKKKKVIHYNKTAKMTTAPTEKISYKEQDDLSQPRKHSRSRSKKEEKKSANKPLIIGLCAVVAILLVSVIVLATKGDSNPQNQKSASTKTSSKTTVKEKVTGNTSWAQAKHKLSGKPFIDALNAELNKTSKASIKIESYRFENGKLTALDLSRNKKLITLKPLNGLEDLNYLNLSNCTKLENLDGLQGTNLQKLDIGASEIMMLKSLKGIEGLPLQDVKLENCKNLEDLDPLLDSKIVRLTILYSNFDQNEFYKFRSMHSLKEIKLGNPQLERELKLSILADASGGEFALNNPNENPPPNNGFNPNGNPPPNNGFNPNGNPPPNNGFNNAGPARIKVRALVPGKFYLNGKFVCDMKAMEEKNIENVPAGSYKFEIKGPLSVKGTIDARSGQKNLITIPNNWMIHSYKGTSSQLVSQYMATRSIKNRRNLLKLMGGESSETSTYKLHNWLVKQQNSDGSWGKSDMAEVTTGLALLNLLSHPENIVNARSDHISRGLEWAVESLREERESYVGDAILTCAVAEAYSMTKHKQLRDVLDEIVMDLSEDFRDHPINGQNQPAGPENPFDPDERRPPLGPDGKRPPPNGNERRPPLGPDGKKPPKFKQGKPEFPPQEKFDEDEEFIDIHSLGWLTKAMRACYIAGIRKDEAKMVMDELSRYINSTYIKKKEVFFDIPDEEGTVYPPLTRAAGISSVLMAGQNNKNITHVYRALLSRDYTLLDFRDNWPELYDFWLFSSNAVYNFNTNDFKRWNQKLGTALKKAQMNDGSYKPSRQNQKIFGVDAKLYASGMAGYILSIPYRYRPYKSLP